MTNIYTLATKHAETGAIVTFGPLMSMAMATRKRDELSRLVKYDIYVINSQSI